MDIAVVRYLGDYMFPRVCHICGCSLTRRERYVCGACMSRMPHTLYHLKPDTNFMCQRFIGRFPFVRATGIFFYSRDNDLSVLMHDLKYHRYRGLARYLGEVAATEVFPSGFLSDIDGLMPVPMHFMKRARRGYNQTEEISKGMSLICGLPVLNNLQASRRHNTQTKMTLEERQKNTAGIFRVDRPGELDGKHILLVDDVCTTGSTLTSAADILLAACPGVKLSMLTLGVTF